MTAPAIAARFWDLSRLSPTEAAEVRALWADLHAVGLPHTLHQRLNLLLGRCTTSTGYGLLARIPPRRMQQLAAIVAAPRAA